MPRESLPALRKPAGADLSTRSDVRIVAPCAQNKDLAAFLSDSTEHGVEPRSASFRRFWGSWEGPEPLPASRGATGPSQAQSSSNSASRQGSLSHCTSSHLVYVLSLLLHGFQDVLRRVSHVDDRLYALPLASREGLL